LIFGGLACAFFIIGVFKKQKNLFFAAILTSAFAYVFTFQGGNLQHAYYQTLILPALAIFAGIGIETLVNQQKLFINYFFSGILIIGILALSWFFSYYTVRNYYSYSQDLISIAKIVKSLTLPDDKIVTDTIGDTTLLYLADRKGYPAPIQEFPILKEKGMKYFVTMQSDVKTSMKKEKKYHLIFENEKFAIFEL